MKNCFFKTLTPWIVLFAIFTCSFVYANPTDGIRYATENYPPYNMADKNGIATGFNTDIVVEMLRVMQSKQTAKDIEVLPWARGYMYAKNMDGQTALFSTTRREARENLFKWVGPLSDSSLALIVLKGNPKNVSIPGPDSYDNTLRYGAIKEDSGESLLLDAGVPPSQVQSVSKFHQLIKLLNIGRIDCISYNPDVAMWFIKQEGFNQNDFESVAKKNIGQHYIAFSKGVSDDIIQQHQAALDQVMANTDLIKSIKSKY